MVSGPSSSYNYLREKQREKQKNKQSTYSTGTVGGLIGAIGSRGVDEGDVGWYRQANVFCDGALAELFERMDPHHLSTKLTDRQGSSSYVFKQPFIY